MDLCPHTHFGTGDRVKGCLMADMTSAQGLCTKLPSVRLSLVETTLTTWTSSEGLSVAPCNLQVVRMITASKDGFCDKSDAEILNSLKDWVSSCDAWILSVTLKRLILLCFIGIGRQYVAADLTCLDRKQCFEKI